MAEFLPGWSTLFGDKPKVPKFSPVDITQSQANAVAGNLAILPDAGSLASRVNALSQEQLDQMNASALPFYGQIKQKVGENILNDVNGVVPDAVARNIRRAGAEQAVYGGFGGSGRQINLTGGKFADETFARQRTGMDSAQRWLATSRAQPFDITSMFLPATTRLQAEMQNNDQRWNQQWLSNQINAQGMPGPLRDYSY